MSAATTTSPDTAFEEAATRARDLNERVIESAKKAGNVTLDGYETTLKAAADFQEKLASASSVEWVSTVAQAQADFTREISASYAKAARALLK